MPLTQDEFSKLTSLIQNLVDQIEDEFVATFVTPTPPPPTQVPAPTYINQPGNYKVTAPTDLIRIESDEVGLDLGGFRVNSIVCGESKPLTGVTIRDGSAGRIFFDRRPHNWTLIDNVNLSGAETAIFPSGNNITIRNCRVEVAGSGYALFIGDLHTNVGLTIEDCSFVSRGPNSLVRICNTDNVVIKRCTFEEEVYHCLRFHGYSRVCRSFLIEDCEFRGTGNGVGIGFDSGAGENYGCDGLVFRRCRMLVTGPDKFNADRNRGGAHARNVQVIDCEGDWT